MVASIAREDGNDIDRSVDADALAAGITGSIMEVRPGFVVSARQIHRAAVRSLFDYRRDQQVGAEHVFVGYIDGLSVFGEFVEQSADERLSLGVGLVEQLPRVGAETLAQIDVFDHDPFHVLAIRPWFVVDAGRLPSCAVRGRDGLIHRAIRLDAEPVSVIAHHRREA